VVDDPTGPRRVSVLGNSGSGKSTLARRAADRLGVPYIELDALFHLPGWTERPLDEFKALIVERTSGDGWVVDGNYRLANSDVVWPRADTLVWLDLPRRRVMRQVVGRTIRRTITREELWNGNRERLSSLWQADPTRSIIRWSWTQHDKYRERYAAAETDPQFAHLTVVRLRSHAEADAWLAGLPAG
jgi:adenylate kinase family enzyme